MDRAPLLRNIETFGRRVELIKSSLLHGLWKRTGGDNRLKHNEMIIRERGGVCPDTGARWAHMHEGVAEEPREGGGAGAPAGQCARPRGPGAARGK